MSRHHLTDQQVELPYREESIKGPVLIALLAVALIAVPLGYWMYRINEEGAQAVNVASYSALIDVVDSDIRTVSAILQNDSAALEAIRDERRKQVVKLIVPEIVIVDEAKPQEPEMLEVELDGIYWSPSTPLVGLNGATYRVGEKIQGYEIIHIGKTRVQFKAADGRMVVKDMYEDLLKDNGR